MICIFCKNNISEQYFCAKHNCHVYYGENIIGFVCRYYLYVNPKTYMIEIRYNTCSIFDAANMQLNPIVFDFDNIQDVAPENLKIKTIISFQ